MARPMPATPKTHHVTGRLLPESLRSACQRRDCGVVINVVENAFHHNEFEPPTIAWRTSAVVPKWSSMSGNRSGAE
jgi:hypothetical protein